MHTTKLPEAARRAPQAGLATPRSAEFVLAAACLIAMLVVAENHAMADDEWLAFRGADTAGRLPPGEYPTHWAPNHNVRWIAQVPGDGHSSPVVADGVVYVTTSYPLPRSAAVERDVETALMCLALVVLGCGMAWVRGCIVLPPQARAARALRSLAFPCGSAALVAATVVAVVFGEKAFDYKRCEIRGWLASCVLLSTTAPLVENARESCLLAFACWQRDSRQLLTWAAKAAL